MGWLGSKILEPSLPSFLILLNKNTHTHCCIKNVHICVLSTGDISCPGFIHSTIAQRTSCSLNAQESSKPWVGFVHRCLICTAADGTPQKQLTLNVCGFTGSSDEGNSVARKQCLACARLSLLTSGCYIPGFAYSS